MVQWKNRKDGGMAKASSSVLKLANTIHRIGKKIRKPKNHAPIVEITTRCVVAIRAILQVSRLRPTLRTRKKATTLAITTATRPPADAVPTSYWISACE